MRVGILGAGKMGAWLAGVLSADHEVAIYDSDSAKTPGVGGVKVLGRLAELVAFTPQILINAVSLESTVDAYDAAVPFLSKECLVADVASVKGEIPRYYEGCGFRFASVHPMFGPTFADLASLAEQNAVIIQESDPEGAAFFEELFRRLGVTVFRYSFREHDEMMAYSLTTPFVSTLVFAACVIHKTVPGTTFARHREIARGLLSESDPLLTEVLFNPQSLKQLDKITSRLEFLKHVIRDRDHEEAERFFEQLRTNVG
jgi:prephenate dehydrogenase